MSKNLVYYFNVADFLEVENHANGDWYKLLALHLDHTLGIDVLMVKNMWDQFYIVAQTCYMKVLLLGKLFHLKKRKILAT